VQGVLARLATAAAADGDTVSRALIVLLVVLSACGQPQPPRHGTITDKLYTPAINGTGSGSGICTGVVSGANGTGVGTGTCFGTVQYHVPETWTLVLRDGKGVWSEKVTAEQWTEAVVGAPWP